MVARGLADHAGHAHVVGIVVFDEILAARGVRHRGLEPRRRGDHLVMGPRAAGAGIDRDRVGSR